MSSVNKSDATRPVKRVREMGKAHYRNAARRGSVKFNSHSNPTKKAYADINNSESKNLLKYNKPDGTENVEVSIRNLLDGTPQQKLKKLCSMGSDKKVGMSWVQFRDKGRGFFEAAKSISKNLPNLYFNMQEDFKARTTYFVFHSISDAHQLMEKYIM
ncbi:hypothetical protein AYI68_g3188 [Smittium mucronatum]|uniref:Uncharacterized protein n=1 Tax=Smittium mucronatum TaxID=133383 RepID=A0A1R0H0M5_9FUNG|nr:hypothetical protein AYI68_g7035 [Smittium mucronatum]OLY82686.1 hypothetical protein AYI68_g3188 [Smittium mucronatum]